MNSNKKTARIVGILFITATVAGVLSKFSFMGSILDAPDYLIDVSANENQVLIGMLLELIMAVAIAAIAIWLYPIFKKHNETLALGYVGARIIEAVIVIVGVIGLLSLVTLSREFVKAAPDATSFLASGTLLLAVRNWSDLVATVIVAGLGGLILNYLLYNSRLIPRWLSVWGLIGATLFFAAGLSGIFGLPTFSTVGTILILPHALNEMVLAVWLIVKGFNPSSIAFLSAKTDINEIK